MALQWHICASPEYLKKHGVPQRPEDLDAHKLILFGNHHPPVPDINWLAEAGRRPGNPRRALLEVNSAARDAAGDPLRPWDRRGARLRDGSKIPTSCAFCPTSRGRRWMCFSSTPRNCETRSGSRCSATSCWRDSRSCTEPWLVAADRLGRDGVGRRASDRVILADLLVSSPTASVRDQARDWITVSAMTVAPAWHGDRRHD